MRRIICRRRVIAGPPPDSATMTRAAQRCKELLVTSAQRDVSALASNNDGRPSLHLNVMFGAFVNPSPTPDDEDGGATFPWVARTAWNPRPKTTSTTATLSGRG